MPTVYAILIAFFLALWAFPQTGQASVGHDMGAECDHCLEHAPDHHANAADTVCNIGHCGIVLAQIYAPELPDMGLPLRDYQMALVHDLMGVVLTSDLPPPRS